MPDAWEYVRFVVPARHHRDSGAAIGVVALVYELVRSDDTDTATRDELSELLGWIEPGPAEDRTSVAEVHGNRIIRGQP